MLKGPSAAMWSVFFLFLSSLDKGFVRGELLGQPLDSDKETEVVFHTLSHTVCVKSSSVGEYNVQQVSNGVEHILSVQNLAGRLIHCAINANRTQVSAFMHDCQLGLREQRIEPTTLEPKLMNVAETKKSCEHLKSEDAERVPVNADAEADGAPQDQKLHRSKRGFTYPGTLWCGAGNIADDYDQLGEFTETDMCCRIHDHCPHVIHAFSSNYGYTNFKWHSISHCDCDNALKQCLRVVNDTSSRVVGQAFFNVIEVPCFELSFEEQCVERHWYGICKRYDKVPVAVIRQSIPYDFGGIEVIDVLTLAPPKKKVSDLDKHKQEETQGSESTTQSSFTGSKSATPEEPSLTNVVTAAEDFIKVLATVSTSQSSSADSSKGEAQTSDKKRKKNAGKKKKDKKRKGKGRGKKRKQNVDKVSKAEEGFAGAPSVSRTEEDISKNHFVEDPGKVRKSNDNFMTGPLDSGVDGGHSNKMMRDEYQRIPDDGQPSSMTTTPDAKVKEDVLVSQKQRFHIGSVPSITHIPTSIPTKPRSTRLRQKPERKRHGHLTPTSFPLEATLHNKLGDNSQVSATESTSLAGQTIRSPISPAREEVQRSSEYRLEKGSIASTQNTPIVSTKRLRLRQRGGRKKSRKLSTSSSPIEGDIPHALTAEEPVELTTDATQELPADTSPHPQSVSELLRQNRLKNLAEISAVSTTGTPIDILHKKRHQRLKGTRDNRRPASSNSNPYTKENTRKEDMISSSTSASIIPSLTDIDSQSLLQTKNAESSTGQLFPLGLPSVSPLEIKKAKRRRSKERENKKRRNNKASET